MILIRYLRGCYCCDFIELYDGVKVVTANGEKTIYGAGFKWLDLRKE